MVMGLSLFQDMVSIYFTLLAYTLLFKKYWLVQ